MSSRRWTIVCLTLTLLIFGCSDSDFVKVKGSIQPGTAGTAASLSSPAASASNLSPGLPTEVEMNAPLEPPQQFPPPGLGLPADHPAIPFEIPQVDGKPVLPPLPGFHAMTDVPGQFSGLSHGGIPVDPKELLGPGRNGLSPGFPPDLPGLELPGFEGGRGAELLRLQQSSSIPKLSPRSSVEDQD